MAKKKAAARSQTAPRPGDSTPGAGVGRGTATRKRRKAVESPAGPAVAERVRCTWVNDDPLYQAYHDEEWGVPVRDGRELFEMLCLEGAQAGLSWYTILKKRDNYRKAFDGFDPVKMARYTDRKRTALLADAGIVRNRLKVDAFITNARCYLEFEQEHGTGSFSKFLWDFVGGKPVVNRPRSMAEVAAKTAASDAMSKALKKLGFKFVGSTICYAFMQACGMIDDHAVDCFRAKGKSA